MAAGQAARRDARQGQRRGATQALRHLYACLLLVNLYKPHLLSGINKYSLFAVVSLVLCCRWLPDSIFVLGLFIRLFLSIFVLYIFLLHFLFASSWFFAEILQIPRSLGICLMVATLNRCF